MNPLRRCQLCGSYYEPPAFHRIPSQVCDRCYLEIHERLSQEADCFIPAKSRRITYPPATTVKQ